MRAATIDDGEVLVREHPDPEPGPGEVLVRVRAAGLNGADMLQRTGNYPAPPGAPQDIPGLEFAGEVTAVGSEPSRFGTGDRVMGIVAGGGQGELLVVHERQAMAIPEGLDWAEAGGLPEAFITAHDAVFTQGELRTGERLCVHGAAGGVGTAAVQLAVATGAEVVATVRDEQRRDAVTQLGAHAVAPDDFGDHGPFDVVLELVGAPNLKPNLAALATSGRIVVIGVGGGPKAELNLLALMGKRGAIRGSTLRARPLEEKALATRRAEAEVLPHVAAGRARVLIDRTFSLDRVADAYDHFAGGGKLGKVVLTLD